MTILCYHEVNRDWRSPLAVTPEAFAAQMTWLARSRRTLALSTATGLLNRAGRLPRGTAAVTFDDGFAGVHRHALPVLIRLGIPATVFLVADTLTGEGKRIDWVREPMPPGVRTLSREQVLALGDAGVAVGSHGSSHRDLVELSDAECERDLRTSREVLEDLLEQPVTFLAYPRGLHDRRVREAARRVGFTHAFTLPERREHVGPLAIPRVGVYRGNDGIRFRLKASRWYLAARASRLSRALRKGSGSTAPARLG